LTRARRREQKVVDGRDCQLRPSALAGEHFA
jgi:hypothetical protein